jgi:microcystin-dependent protein
MIQIIDGFNLQTATPIDSRIVVADEDERLAITSAYPGLRVWQVDTSTPYFWDTVTDTGMPDWKSELDLVVTGSGNTDSIPRFETTGSPSKLIDSQISDDGSKVSIVNNLEVGGDLKVTGVLDSDLNADRINEGKLDLQYLDNDGSEGDVLLLDTSGIPTWDSVKNISIGTSETTNQVKIEPITLDREYRIILSDTNDTLTGSSDLALSSYDNNLVIKQSTSSSDVCILAHGGTKENPPYSFYDTTTSTATPLGGMYYSGDSIDFSIGSEPKFKIKDGGVYIEPDTTNNPSKFTNVKNSIGVPVGGIIMWSGDESDIGNGDLWNYMLCDNSTVSGPFTDNYGTSFTPTYVGSTPNLVNKFIIAAGGIHDIEDEGGEDGISLDVGNIPSHTHSFTGIDVSGETNNAGEHSHQAQAWTHGTPGIAKGVLDFKSVNKNAQQDGVTDSKESIKNDGLHKHTFSAEISGSTDGGSGTSGNSFDNRPRFFALAFIIRVV